MSTTEVAVDEICASCGSDDIKLRKCTACKLVRYCSVKCQKEHRSRQKRAAELRVELLLKQPESTHLGDCPICFIPIPFDPDTFSMNACCSKIICLSCIDASGLLANQETTCPFFRHLIPKTQAESDLIKVKRIEANDPVAMHHSEAFDTSPKLPKWVMQRALSIINYQGCIKMD